MNNATSISLKLWSSLDDAGLQQRWREFMCRCGRHEIHSGPDWLAALCEGLRHEPYVIEATEDQRVVGLLPLSLVKSMLFGRFLVSLPYVNWAGVIAEDEQVAAAMIDRAVELADELDVRYLELRHETRHEHPALTHELVTKAHMRLPLASSPEPVFKQLKSVVRTQIRKGEKQQLTVHWGRLDLLDEFYAVFAQNMRDLGTPVYSRRLFESILTHCPDETELCVVRLGSRAIAGSLAVHGGDITEVPSASSLRRYRSTAANSLMYWHAIERAIERGQSVFDFGRSTIDGGTYVFKKKWGAQPEPAVWQYYVRKGNVADMRPDGGKYNRMINIWRRLPVSLTRLIGPAVVRGIP